jgi:streptogramin lyase
MCYAKRVAILMVVLSAIAWASGPARVGAWAETTVASSTNTLNAMGPSDDGEVWVTAQDADQLKIVLGLGGVETVALPAGSQPHTITSRPKTIAFGGPTVLVWGPAALVPLDACSPYALERV